LDALTHRVFDNNPVPVNLILMSIAVLVGSTLVLFIWKQSAKLDHKRLNAQAYAAEEHETLMPGATIPEEDDSDADSGRVSPRGGYGTVSRN
jgi:hypothetical protein